MICNLNQLHLTEMENSSNYHSMAGTRRLSKTSRVGRSWSLLTYFISSNCTVGITIFLIMILIIILNLVLYWFGWYVYINSLLCYDYFSKWSAECKNNWHFIDSTIQFVICYLPFPKILNYFLFVYPTSTWKNLQHLIIARGWDK